MRTFLNILWHFPFFGFVAAFFMALIGLLWCVTIVGLPIGLGLLQVALFMLAPHTHTLVSKDDVSELTGETQSTAWKVFALIVRILYFPIGLFVAAGYIFVGIAECCTIIGIPQGIVYFKMIGALFNPVNKVCVPLAVSNELDRRREQRDLDRYMGRNSRPAPYRQNGYGPQPYGPQPQPYGPQPAPYGGSPYAGGQRQPAGNVRKFSDEDLALIAAQPEVYNPELVEAVRHEIEVRANSANVQSVIDGYSDKDVMDILNNPERYSEEMVYCAQKRYSEIQERLKKEQQERRAEEERKRAEQRALEQKQAEERKEQLIAFFKKWKYAFIAGGVALIVLFLLLWLNSDRHRFSNAESAYEHGKWLKAAQTAAKIDDPSSDYFDAAMILSISALDNYRAGHDGHHDADDIWENRMERMAQVVQNDVYENKHITLTWFYAKKMYDWYGASPQLAQAARYMLRRHYGISDAERYAAGVALFISREYDEARDVFMEIANKPEAKSYLGVINLFKLCTNPCSGRDAWDYIRYGSSTGRFGLLAGDARLRDRSARNYDTRLEQADFCYSNATLPDEWPYEFLTYRRHIVNQMRNETRLWNDYYRFNSGEYNGQTLSRGWNKGANGWGVFSWDNRNVKYGKYRYNTNGSDDIEYLYIPSELSSTSSIWAYNSQNNKYYGINSTGSITYDNFYIPFDPLWYFDPEADKTIFNEEWQITRGNASNGHAR